MSENRHLSEVEQSLITAVELPTNQGEPLQARDYVALAVVTVLIPVLLILLGELT